MQQYIHILRSYLKNKTLCFHDTDINSILEFIWHSYTECNPIHTQTIQKYFEDLEPIMEKLSFDDSTLLFPQSALYA